jgi:hypothetical protein
MLPSPKPSFSGLKIEISASGIAIPASGITIPCRGIAIPCQGTAIPGLSITIPRQGIVIPRLSIAIPCLSCAQLDLRYGLPLSPLCRARVKISPFFASKDAPRASRRSTPQEFLKWLFVHFTLVRRRGVAALTSLSRLRTVFERFDRSESLGAWLKESSQKL